MLGIDHHFLLQLGVDPFHSLRSKVDTALHEEEVDEKKIKYIFLWAEGGEAKKERRDQQVY